MDSDDGGQRVIPFQLQFDKSLASQIRIAEWNPEKDLLAMVTEDSKVMLHRFNWQRLWTISPGKSISSICWRPDGKVLALGLEDGTISLHDVENGKLLRSLKPHTTTIVCLNWEEDMQLQRNGSGYNLSFEDRTPRFFPPSPRVPQMPGLVSGDAGFTEDGQDSFVEFANSSHQRLNILCSGDRDGTLLFSIFGIFPIGKIHLEELHVFLLPKSEPSSTYWMRMKRKKKKKKLLMPSDTMNPSCVYRFDSALNNSGTCTYLLGKGIQKVYLLCQEKDLLSSMSNSEN